MYIWINDKYSSTSFKQRLWQRKIALTWQNFSNQVCQCGALVKELLARADKPSSTPGDAVFCFFVPFFSVWSLFFTTIFPLGLFFFILSADPAGQALGSIYILTLSPEFYFGKGISKALDLHTGQAYDQKKNISCQDMSLLWKSWIFFSVSWHRDKRRTVHHKLY